MRRLWLVLGELAVCLIVSAPSAAPAEPSPQELALVRELWERAVAAQEQADWPACEQALAEAVPIVETPGLRFNLAYCREMQTKWVEALVDYKLAEELIQSGVQAQDVAELLPPAMARLEPKIPKLTILVDRVPERAHLFIDGKRVSVNLLGKPISLNPGSHMVELAATGLAPISRRISLLESEVRELEFELRPVQTLDDRETVALSVMNDDASSFSAKPYVMAAQALIALGASGVAAYYLIDAEDAQQQVRFSSGRLDGCEGGGGSLECSTSERNTLQEEVAQAGHLKEEYETSALAWGIAGGVAATSLLVTWVLWPEEEGLRQEERFQAQVQYDRGKITISGTF